MIIDGLAQEFNLEKFNKTAAELEAKYGLPREVKFCKVCTISNQRPNSSIEFKHNTDSKKQTINFDTEGVCDACRFAEKKRIQIDWGQREKELIALCNQHRGDGRSYDCLIPGSGGKDSVYAAHVLKYKYGMNPLTVTWAPHIYTDWGRKNHESWIQAGFDNVLFSPNGKIHRLLTRLAVENLFHPFQPFILGQKNLAPRLASLWNIPLIFYGENEAEYGNPIADADKSVRNESYFAGDLIDNFYLGGQSVRSLQDDFGVPLVELSSYFPVDPKIIKEKNIQVHYLGYYLKWHPQSCYYYAVDNIGFIPSPERTPGTYSKYNSIDDRIDDFHYYTTYIKFGIGRATYDSAQEIRSGDINRDEGVALVKRYDGEYPTRFDDEIFNYLSITEKDFGNISKKFAHPVMDKEYFLKLADRFRSPHLWKFEGGQWKLRHTVWG